MKLFKKTKVQNAEADEDQEVEEPEAENADAAKTGPKRGMSVLDFILRIIAALGTLGSAIAMRNTNGSLPFLKEFFRFRAKYDDLPTFTFFVVANAIVSAYLVLSLVLSIFHIVKSGARITRAILIILDTVMLAFLMSGASAAAAIVHLAHKGNSRVNWAAICHQYNSFCGRVSGSLVGSFIGILLLLLFIILSALALARS